MRSSVVVLLACGLYGATLATLGEAHADEKQACLGAFDRAQQLRIEGKLRAAKDQLAICARAECPQLVRQDCAQWQNEVMTSLPSVVIGARDDNGKDVMAVRVSIDGVLVAETLDGKSIALDPGAHKFHFEAPGTSTIDEQLLIREGEKNRVITVRLSAKSDSLSPPKGLASPSALSGTQKSSTPAPVYILGAVGVVALGAALFFDLKGNGDAITLRTVCAPSCRQSDVDAVQTKYVAAGVSLGIGVVALGFATYLYVSHVAPPKSTAWNLALGRF